MTGAEFASKYTVLKPLDQRAVRSFVAQEQSTRRAVMVHWLDGLSSTDRSAILARIDRLPADARDRVLAIETVDGAPVVVTRMILDFDSFPKWLDRVLPVTQAPQAPPVPSSGGFTDIFVSTPVQQKGTPVAAIDSPTISWTPPKAPEAPKPKAPEPPRPKAPEPPKQPSISVRFREPGSGPKPPAPPPKPAAPPPPPPKAPSPGEFTRIFGATHVEPEPPVPPPAAAPQFMPPPPPPAIPLRGSGNAPSATSAMERVVAPSPRTSVPPPPPPLSPSSPWSGPPPVVPLPPASSGSATPMPGANINLPPSAPVMPAQPVQSDFTRIIGAAHAAPPSVAPPPTPAAPAPAAATPAKAAAGAAGKKVVSVLVAFGTLVLAALVLVVMALIRRH